MPDLDHPSAWPVEQLLKRCVIERLRRGGPGGQHRNKVETAVVIRDEVTGTSAEASEKRSQEANRQVALFRLRLAMALDPTACQSIPTETSSLWKGRCRNGRISINPHHNDFPALVAEAIVNLNRDHWEVAASAKKLGCSTNQLVKLLKLHYPAFSRLNQERERLGLSGLK